MFAPIRTRRTRHVRTHFIQFDQHACKACWACVDVCPQHVIGKVDLFFHKHAHIDRAEACKGCLRCVKACPNQALTPIFPIQRIAEDRGGLSDKNNAEHISYK